MSTKKSELKKDYEVLFIVRPNLDEDSTDKIITSIEDYLKNLGSTDVTSEKKGRRRLSYEVGKMRDGYYVLTKFQANGTVIEPFKRMLNLSEDILRSMIACIPKGESSYALEA